MSADGAYLTADTIWDLCLSSEDREGTTPPVLSYPERCKMEKNVELMDVKVFQRLRKAGMNEDQAQTISEHMAAWSHMPTKVDLEKLRHDLTWRMVLWS